MNLLIVDDNVMNLKLLRAQLEAEAHCILEATDGVEALRVLDREIVDGIISDILMPNMDGFRLCLEVRKNARLAALPFVFYTSTYSSPQDQQLAKTVGGDKYLSKPSPTALILEALRDAAQRTRGDIAVSDAQPDESYVLKQYNAALVRKVEQRNVELEDALRQLQSLNRIYAMLSSINALIVRVNNRQDLFSGACRIAVEHGGFGMAWVGALDPQSLDITPMACAGIETESLLARSGNTARADAPLGQGLAGRAIREKRAVFSNDLQLERTQGGERRKEAIRRGYRSLIVLPLLIEGAATAILALFVKEKDFFNADEVRLLTELAGNISFALEHMARQQQIDKLARIRAFSSAINATIVRIRERKALLIEACRIAFEQGKFTMAWIGTVDTVKQDVVPTAWAGFSPEVANGVTWASIDAAQGALGEAILSRKPAVRNDIESELPRSGLRLEALQHGCGSTVSLPIVVENRVEALLVLFAAGKDFFDKDELALIDEVAADIAFALQTIDKQDKLDYLHHYDVLTGLPNRLLFVDRVGQRMRSHGEEPLMVALILVNLERFRHINQTLGRHSGDALLKLVARRLERAFHGQDHLARIGADDFGVVMSGIQNAGNVVHAVETQVLRCFNEPFNLNGIELRVAARAGIALSPADGDDADTLFRNAEAALKNARNARERVLFYSADMNARAASLMSLETRLRNAVEAQQFVLHYQPKIDLARGRICGLEALIRWQDPGAGLVAPGTFIPLLEETGLILEVGQWALIRALAQHREWTARGVAAPRIAVNVSAIQLQRKDFADVVIGILQQAGGNPEALEIEITESMLMNDIAASIEKLAILRCRGIHIAMDDFGTGYSSLSYVARLPLDAVKIDRSFINGMAGNPQDYSIVSTIIALTHSLKLTAVAEGVETEDQSKLLKLLKCDEAQGYLFSKPLPPDDIETLLRDQG